MKAVRILLSAGILTAIAGTTFAADERIVTDEGVATFSLGLTHKSKKLMHYSPENSITISGFLSCSRI